MSRSPRTYAGVSKLKKILQRMEPTIQREFANELESAGRELKNDAIMFATLKQIRDSGDLIASIDYKVSSRGDSVVVGPGAAALTWQKRPWDNQSEAAQNMSIKQKRMKWQFFKGYWAEFGTKGASYITKDSVRHTQYGPVKVSGGQERKIPPQPAKPFMGPTWDNNKVGLQKRFANLWRESLRLTSEG